MGSKIIFQGQRFGCGFSTIKIALVNLTGRKDYEYAPEPLISGDEPPSLLELINYAASLGLELQASKLLNKEEIVLNDKYPLLVVMEYKLSKHLVYLESFRNGKFILLDSKRGKVELSKEEFLSYFSGIILHVNGFVDNGISYEKPCIVPFKTKFLSVVFSTLPIASLSAIMIATSLSFPENISNFILIGLLASFLLFIFLNYLFQKRSMLELDNKYLGQIDDDDLKIRMENFIHYNEFKKLSFSSVPLLISSLFLLFTVTLIFTLNDLYLGVLVCIVYSLQILDKLTLNKKINKQIEDLSMEEEYYLSTNKEESFRNSILLNIISKSNKLSSKIILKTILFYFLTILLCVPIFIINKDTYTLKDSIFAIFTIIYLIYSVNKVFNLGEDLVKKKKEESYFILHFVNKDYPKEMMISTI